MKRIVDLILDRARRFDEHAFFRFIGDASIDPRQRLGYAPCIAHFVMSFADMCTLVFRQEPAQDPYQELVNAHTYEDGDHHKWYLADLARLGCDERLPFSDALKLVWGEHSVRLRRLSYEICHLALHSSSLQKLVLLQCIESAFKVSLTHVVQSARDFTARGGQPLLYFGSHHVETEEQHTLEGDAAHDLLSTVELEQAAFEQLAPLIERIFTLFDGFADDLLAFALDRSPLAPSAAQSRAS